MSYFAAVLVRSRNRWQATEVDLDDCESVEDIAEVTREVPGEVRLLVVEQDDEYAVLARVDAGEDPRVFLSDAHAADAYPLASVIAAELGHPVDGDSLEADGLDGDLLGADLLGDAPLRHDSIPVGDPSVAEDLGTAPHELLDLCAREGTLPVDVILAVCERAGCEDAFEAVRGVTSDAPAVRGLDDDAAMGRAIDVARGAAASADVPVGAVLLAPSGAVLAVAHNEREATGDPTAHAELLALRRGAAAAGSWQLAGCTLVVTLEPCTMCAGAVVLARLARLVFGAWDAKAGAVGSVWDVVRDRRSNHRPEVVAGVRAEECAALLTDFFAARRR